MDVELEGKQGGHSAWWRRAGSGPCVKGIPSRPGASVRQLGSFMSHLTHSLVLSAKPRVEELARSTFLVGPLSCPFVTLDFSVTVFSAVTEQFSITLVLSPL